MPGMVTKAACMRISADTHAARAAGMHAHDSLPAPPQATASGPSPSRPHLTSKVQPGSSCPGKADSQQKLEDARAHGMAFSALLALSDDPSPLSEVLLLPLDEDEPAQEPPPSSLDWLVWLVQQMELEPEQVRALSAWRQCRCAVHAWTSCMGA